MEEITMPFKPEEREYRSFDFELRSEGENDYTVRGYASTYLPYTIFKSASSKACGSICSLHSCESDLKIV